MTGLTNGVTAHASTAALNSGLPATNSSKTGSRLVFRPLAQTKVMAASQVAADTTLKASGSNLYNSTAPSAPIIDQIRSESALKDSEAVRRAFSKTNSPILTPATASRTVPEQPLTAPSVPNLPLQSMNEANNKAAKATSGSKEILKRFDQLLGTPQFDIRMPVGAILKKRISKEELLEWALQRNVDPKAIEALVAYKAITTEDLENWNTRRFQQQSHLSKTAIPTVAATSASSSSVSTTRASAGAVAPLRTQQVKYQEHTTLDDSAAYVAITNTKTNVTVISETAHNYFQKNPEALKRLNLPKGTKIYVFNDAQLRTLRSSIDQAIKGQQKQQWALERLNPTS